MADDTTIPSDRVFRTTREFEETMFPRAFAEREISKEQEDPFAAGSRLAEAALSGLKRTADSSAS